MTESFETKKSGKAAPVEPAQPVRFVPPSLANPDKRPMAIPVRVAIFNTPRNIPGEDSTLRVKCEGPLSGRRYWTCDFIPSMRHHEITYYPPDAREPAQRCYIHESHVDAWYPLV